MSAFLKMIPAERGWRVVRVWEDAGKPHFEYEAVIAWGELEEKSLFCETDGANASCGHSTTPTIGFSRCWRRGT